MKGRGQAEQRMTMDARLAWRAMKRAAAVRDRAAEQVEAHALTLAALHRKTCDRFGREVPVDALLLDVLQCIDIEDGDRWVWRGMHNNKGVPTFRQPPGRERTVARYLGIAFGVLSEDDQGTFYPNVRGDRDDVNPWHRTLRAGNGKRMGNPDRYAKASS